MSYGRYASRAMIGVGIGFAVKSFKDVVQPVASKLGINQSFEFLGSLGADDTMLLGDSSSELYNRYLGAAPQTVEPLNGVTSAAPTTIETVAGLGGPPIAIETQTGGAPRASSFSGLNSVLQ